MDWKRETELAMARIYERLGTPHAYVELVIPYELAVYQELPPPVAAVMILTARLNTQRARQAHELSIAAFNA